MKIALVRFGLIVVALAAITLGLNLMNVRDNLVVFAGFVAMIGGLALGGWQVRNILKGIQR
jgi:hypothetical protein